MLMRWRCRPVAAATLAVFLTSCVATRLPPISATGAAFTPLRDELRLWEEARSEEQTLLAELPLYEDPLLEDYLNDIVGRLISPGMAANSEIGYRVRVVEDPSLNAFAYPHGAIYVHTGLIARMENEDQLATVLAHEMTHVENRHALRHRRAARNRQVGFSIAAISAALILAHEQGEAWGDGRYGRAAQIGILGDLMVSLGLQLAFLAAVNGYGRKLEDEADAGGFQRMRDAGYDLREAPRVYEALMDDHGEPGNIEAYFFGSHPKLSQRIANAEAAGAGELAAADGRQDGEEEAAQFRRRTRAVVRDDAALNIDAGRLHIAEAELARAREALPDDPEVAWQTYRLRSAQAEQGGEGAARQAREAEAAAALEEARRLGSRRPEIERELGLLAYRAGDRAAACAAFERYLAVAAGDAADRERFEDYRRELARDGYCPAA